MVAPTKTGRAVPPTTKPSPPPVRTVLPPTPPSAVWCIFGGFLAAIAFTIWVMVINHRYGTRHGVAKYWLVALILPLVAAVLWAVTLVTIGSAVKSANTSELGAPKVPAVSHSASVLPPEIAGPTYPGSQYDPALGINRPTKNTPVRYMVTELMDIRQQAFTQDKPALLNAFWEYHGMPKPVPFDLPNTLKPTEPTSPSPVGYYNRDAYLVGLYRTNPDAFGATYANYPLTWYHMGVFEQINPTTLVIGSKFINPTTHRVVSYFTGLYELKSGYWVVNQLRRN